MLKCCAKQTFSQPYEKNMNLQGRIEPGEPFTSPSMCQNEWRFNMMATNRDRMLLFDELLRCSLISIVLVPSPLI